MKKYIIAFLGGLSLLNSCNLTDLEPEPELIKAICLWSGSDYPKLLQAKQGMLQRNYEEFEEIKRLHPIRRRLITERAEVQFSEEVAPYTRIFESTITIDEGIKLCWDTGHYQDNPRYPDYIDDMKVKFNFTAQEALEHSKQVYLATIFECLEGGDFTVHFEHGKNGIPVMYGANYSIMRLDNFSFKSKPYDPASFFLDMINFCKVTVEILADHPAAPDFDRTDYEELEVELAELFDEMVKAAKAEMYLYSVY